MVLTSSRLLCHILVAVVVPKEHRGEDLGPENPEAADHHGEDENSLAVAEQAALEVGGVILIIRVVWLQHNSDNIIIFSQMIATYKQCLLTLSLRWPCL